MEQVIWKYELKPNNTTIEMPKSAHVISAGTQIIDGQPEIVIWVIVDVKTEEKQKRQFMVLGTGHHFHDIRDWQFLNTVQMAPDEEAGFPHGFAFHVFEIREKAPTSHGATRHPC